MSNLMWWGYLDKDGSAKVSRWLGTDKEFESITSNPALQGVVPPFPAKTFNEAEEILKEKLATKPVEETAVAIVPPQALVATASVPTPDIQVTAENADEMAQCQSAIIAWTKRKLHQMEFEHGELEGAYKHAVKSKWKNDVLKRHTAIALKRVEFYSKMLVALEHGYQIVPNFPVTAFAVRTDRKKPLRMVTTHQWANHEQAPMGLPEGEGAYKNPFPVLFERTIEKATETKGAVKNYWASDWDEFEFPISMAKPQIMEATTRAMALKIFDDFGILPGAPKQDPMIIARLCLVRSSHNRRWLSFIVAWHLDTRVLP